MSKTKLNKINIVDLECTCWENNWGPPKPENESQEIIEIGVCTVNLHENEISDKRSIIIKPQFSTISEFCTSINGFTQDEVDKGVTYNDACEIMRKEYSSRNRAWASWGEFDRTMFYERNATLYPEVNYPLSGTHINLKPIFSLVMGFSKQFGVEGALKHLGLEFEGVPHKGIDDAFNTAKIFLSIFERQKQDKLDRIEHKINLLLGK